MIHTVIFDLDGTLYDYDSAHERAFHALADWTADVLDISAERLRTLHRKAMDRQIQQLGNVSASIHNRIIRCQLILEATGHPVYHALTMSDIYWSAFLHDLAPYPGTAAGLHALRQTGIRVGIGTNMTAEQQYRKLHRLGLLEQVDFMLASEEVGADKPDQRFFAACMEKAQCPPAQCVFVGDNPAHDVLAPLREGMRAVWFCPSAPGTVPEGMEAVFRIASLEELPTLLKGMA